MQVKTKPATIDSEFGGLLDKVKNNNIYQSIWRLVEEIMANLGFKVEFVSSNKSADCKTEQVEGRLNIRYKFSRIKKIGEMLITDTSGGRRIKN